MARNTEVMQLSGIKELQRALKECSEVAVAEIEQAIASSTFSMTQRMRSLAVERTGTLRRAIAGKATGLNGRVTIGREAYYWRFLEYGTIHMPARPFVRQSVEEEAPQFEKRLRTVAGKMERAFASGGLR